jgi:LacI family transcriptional regulator
LSTSVRQQDIAAELGLSVSTVSLALRDAAQVAEETRLRVREAAKRMGYTRRRPAARHTVAQIAYIAQIDRGNVFYAAVLSGVEHECRRLGITLHYTRIETFDERAQASLCEADALLAAGTIPERTIRGLMRLARPLVLVDNNLAQLGVDRVLIENYGSTWRAVEYLARLGHRRIAHLRGPLDHPSFRDRQLGYRGAVEALGLEPIELRCEDVGPGGTAPVVDRWLDAHGANFTALCVFHDEAAVEAIHALQDRGLQVPADISVVGFDDIEMARLVRPALTTCHVYREQLGALAVRRLIERAAHPEAPPTAVTLDTTLVERASTRALT